MCVLVARYFFYLNSKVNNSVARYAYNVEDRDIATVTSGVPPAVIEFAEFPERRRLQKAQRITNEKVNSIVHERESSFVNISQVLLSDQ